MALQDERAVALLSGMPEAERMASWHLVRPDGAVSSAGAAAPTLLRLLPGGAPLAAFAERFRQRWSVATRGSRACVAGSETGWATAPCDGPTP